MAPAGGSAGLREDPDGRAVALVDIIAVRNWKEEDLEATGPCNWEPGWLAWELANVRAFDYDYPLSAKIRIYQISLVIDNSEKLSNG